MSRYELQLAPGTKVAKVAQLRDDLAYALASTDIRILAPIPGKKAVGVEVPNQRRRLVRLGDIYGERPKGASPLLSWLGKDVSGQAVSADLALMPHVLVAGTTGSGKSGCINAILTSILMHASPNEVRLVLVDPKRVELNHYERLPHLLTPVVTNPRLAANVLANLIGEMESRYAVMSEARARNLVELNRARKRAGEPPLPHILCVIDELADLMMVAPAEVEDSIIRLAQKARAIGIHLVLATQRPSTDVITGTIKVNIPSRIAFAVASQVDSRVILDGGGAETLLGQGDMLFRPVGTSKLNRIQGAFVTEEEIARVCGHWAKQGEPEFDEELLEAKEPEIDEGAEGEFSPDQDDLLADAARIVVESETASVSMIQRRLRVGYTRAGRLIDMLERRGIISGYEGSKPRQVLVSQSELPRLLDRIADGIVEDAAGGEASRRPRPSSSRSSAERRDNRRRDGWRASRRDADRRGAAGRAPARRARHRARSRSGPRSGSSTCARSRTRTGRRCPARPTRRASCAPTRSCSGSTARRSSTSTAARSSRAATARLPARRPGARDAGDARRAGVARRGSGRRSRSPWWRCSRLLLVIGLSGDDDGSEGERRQARDQERGAGDGAGKDGPKRERAEGTVTLALSVREPVEVCLLGGGDEALIDGQVLAAGTEESLRAAQVRAALPVRLRRRSVRARARRQDAAAAEGRRAGRLRDHRAAARPARARRRMSVGESGTSRGRPR